MTNPIVASQPQMAQQGIRRLLILSGQADWSRQQAIMLRQHLAGDWLWLSEQPPEGVNSISPTAARTLLGQENLHGVFDATDGLNIEALAIVAGTLRAGSWLLLLVPEWDDWPQRPDKDSLRWSEQPARLSQRTLSATYSASFWLIPMWFCGSKIGHSYCQRLVLVHVGSSQTVHQPHSNSIFFSV